MENRNNTSFPKILNEYVRKLGDPGDLRKHQQITSAYSQIATGILAMHGLGSGKTRLAVSIMLRAAEMGRPVIFLTNKSLHDNMRKELDSIYKANPEVKRVNISFVTMNASNMMTQMRRALNLDDNALVRLEGRTLVVDEAHNLFNSITNGSENSMQLYESIMHTKDLKTLFLTATPIVNSPFETAICYNMLARERVLPESYEDFNRFFVDGDMIRNADKFKARIIGLTSYYGDFYNGFQKLSEDISKPDFPTQKATIIIECPMSPVQYSTYYIARGIEQSEASYSSGVANLLQKPSGSASSSYRVLSRQISNVVPPNNKISYTKGRMRLAPYKFSEIASDVATHSPKLIELMKKLNQPGKHLIYSSFVEQGINLIADMLSHEGLSQIGEFNRYTHGGDGMDIRGVYGADANFLDEDEGPAGRDEDGHVKYMDFIDDIPYMYDNNEESVYDLPYTAFDEPNILDRSEVLARMGFYEKEHTIEEDLDILRDFLSKKGGKGEKDPKPPVKLHGKFIVITGETKVEDRQQLVSKFNSDPSINIVLLSGAGSEGLDFKGFQYVHLFEPYWNFLRLQQVIGRAVRFRSHDHLPKEMRWVQPYLYIAQYPDGASDRLTKSEKTTNMEMYEKSRTTNRLIQQFYKAMAEASIECDYFNKNKQLHCFICAPTDRDLYLPNIYKDMNYKLNCEKPNESDIKAEEFTYLDKRYAKYKKDGKVVYLIYREDLDGYVEAPMGDPIYDR